MHTCCFFLGALLLALSAAPSPAAMPQRFTYYETHMGTRFQVTLYAADEAAATRGAKAAFARIAALDAMMSDYRSDSELMRLCEKAGGPPVHVSKDLFFVLSRAQEVSSLSGGAFDVTVGPIVRLWRHARRTQQMPDPQKLAHALSLVGYQYVRLNKANQTVQLLRSGMRLDLGGIAKGYAADAALDVLKQQGIIQALVAAGGDIAVSGPPPGRKAWRIGIAPLEDPGRKPSRYLLLHDAAVSTSGDFEQHVVINGQRYSHIVNPKTGVGIVGQRSVTVVAPHGILADSLTKIPSVLGPERGLPLIEQVPGAAASMVLKTDGGQKTSVSPRFSAIPQEVEKGE